MDDGFCGNVFCLMAIGRICTCRCEGEWHGAGRLRAEPPPRPPVAADPPRPA